MRGVTDLEKQAFLRWVYLTADAQGLERSELLDSLLVGLVPELVQHGKILQSASGGGDSATYALIEGWDTSTRLALVEWARAYIGFSTVEEAIAAIPPNVRTYRRAVTGLRMI